MTKAPNGDGAGDEEEARTAPVAAATGRGPENLAGPPELDELDRQLVLAQIRQDLFGSEAPLPQLGRFEVAGRIGSGASGVVYVAHDRQLDRDVAVKVLSVDDSAPSETHHLRLLREGQALAKLAHPNVVAVHDIGTHEGTVFIAMELAAGVPLGRWLGDGERAWREILRVLVEAGRGLAAAHERGLVHRDFKPANVIVDERGTAKVVDFGLARAEPGREATSTEGPLEAALTHTGAVMGTPAYAAPEQLRGEGANELADQYAFCATAYEALYGSPPTPGEGPAERVLAKMARAAPMRPERTEVPQRVTKALLRGLAPDPAERHPSMQELLTELDAAVSGSPRWGGGRRALAGGALAATVAVAGWIAWTSHPADEASAKPAAGLGGRADSVLACPIVEATGVVEPSTWLGAATASLACRRARWALGGRTERVRAPAELLGLPRRPVEEFPADVYVEADARARSLEAARRDAAALIDGFVRREPRRFVVQLRLELPDGQVLARGEGRQRALYAAVRDAMKAIESTAAIPRADRVSEEVTRWTFVEKPTTGIYLDELHAALQATLDADGLCDQLEKHATELGGRLVELRRRCADALDLPTRGERVTLDRSSPASLAATAPAWIEDDPARDARPLADELATARAAAPTSLGKATLALAESRLRALEGAESRARALRLEAAAHRPGSWDVWTGTATGSDAHTTSRAASATIAWTPDDPAAWSRAVTIAGDCRARDPRECAESQARVEMQRRAYELGEGVPVYGMHYGLRLVRQGRQADARVLGTSLLASGDGHRLAAAYVLGFYDMGHARFGRAYDRLKGALEAVDRLDSGRRGAVSVLMQLDRLAEVMGREREVGDFVAQRFALAEPPRLPWRSRVADVPVMAACLDASRALAERCLARIRELRTVAGRWRGGVSETERFVRGAERYVAGDPVGAAEAWRPLVERSYYWVQLPVAAFEDAGETELAARLDERHLARHQLYAGRHPAFVRAAKRAATAGKRDEARRIAEDLVRSWGGADVVVPAVADMQRLIKRLR